MGGACRILGTREMRATFLWEQLKGLKHVEDLDLEEIQY
jgi:hypothetical protein